MTRPRGGGTSAAVSPGLSATSAGPGTNQLVRGTGADDELYGTEGADILQGLNGDDDLSGLGGDDLLEGSAGDDTLDGGAGNDTLRNVEDLNGSFFDDHLVGNDEDNYLFGYYGDDRIDGGGGSGDLATFIGEIHEVVVRYDASTGWLTVQSLYDGTDQLRNVESLYFYLDTFDASLFTTPAAPHAIAHGPAPGSTAVPVSSDLRITFQEPIQRGSGSVVLRDASGREVERFEAGSPRLQVEGMNLVVDPTDPLTRNKIGRASCRERVS
jgi:hypothetical protein